MIPQSLIILFLYVLCEITIISATNGDKHSAFVPDDVRHNLRGSSNDLTYAWKGKIHAHNPRTHHRMVLASLAFPQLYNCKSKGPPLNLPDSEFHASVLSNEDIWLHRHIFSKLPPSESMSGYFIEIGAVDGMDISNSYFFEKRYDWRGLLIEGQFDNALKLRQNAPVHRTNAVAFTNSICKLPPNQPSGCVTFTATGGAIAATLQGAKQGFLDHWHSNLTERNSGKNITCVPMQSLLEMTGVLDVELFSLDVEGAELEVLHTINFDITNIRVVVIEIDGHDKPKNQRVRDFMASHGFITTVEAKLGKITDACNETTYGFHWNCMPNEAFINPHYAERKAERAALFKFQRYYVNGTGLACDD